VKKLFAISLLFIYLFSSSELHQLLKAPLLIEHFIEHREENKHVTLSQFLYTHYAINHGNDADHDKDMKLPFKTHNNCISFFSNVYLPSVKVSIEKSIEFLQEKRFTTKDQFLLPSHFANIWQPPRVC
jgi:hypothetical protein